MHLPCHNSVAFMTEHWWMCVFSVKSDSNPHCGLKSLHIVACEVSNLSLSCFRKSLPTNSAKLQQIPSVLVHFLNTLIAHKSSLIFFLYTRNVYCWTGRPPTHKEMFQVAIEQSYVLAPVCDLLDQLTKTSLVTKYQFVLHSMLLWAAFYIYNYNLRKIFFINPCSNV